MGKVIEFKRKKEKFVPATILEMLSNPEKRKQTYEYYDSIYEETEDEKEIFEAWRNNGK